MRFLLYISLCLSLGTVAHAQYGNYQIIHNRGAKYDVGIAPPTTNDPGFIYTQAKGGADVYQRFGDKFAIGHFAGTPGIYSSEEVEHADIDLDGDWDLIGLRYDHKVVVVRNLGEGQFSDEEIVGGYDIHLRNLNIIDFHSDGDPDFLFTNWSSSGNYRVGYRLNDGQGNFSDYWYGVSGTPRAVKVADFDNDDDDDFLYINETEIYLNRDTGSIDYTRTMIGTTPGLTNDVLITDLDNDNDLDILLLTSNGLFQYENLGGQLFSSPQELLSDFSGLQTMILLDTDHDNDLDYPESLNTGDADGDGDLDLLFGTSYDDLLILYRNTEEGFQAEAMDSRSLQEQGLLLTDMENDGEVDLFIPSYQDKYKHHIIETLNTPHFKGETVSTVEKVLVQ